MEARPAASFLFGLPSCLWQVTKPCLLNHYFFLNFFSSSLCLPIPIILQPTSISNQHSTKCPSSALLNLGTSGRSSDAGRMQSQAVHHNPLSSPFHWKSDCKSTNTSRSYPRIDFQGTKARTSGKPDGHCVEYVVKLPWNGHPSSIAEPSSSSMALGSVREMIPTRNCPSRLDNSTHASGRNCQN
jgi:hypothetical protein